MGKCREKGERNESKLILDILTNNTNLTRHLVPTDPQSGVVAAAFDFAVILLFAITLDGTAADDSGTPWALGAETAQPVAGGNIARGGVHTEKPTVIHGYGLIVSARGRV